ncbi:cell division initiation protein [Ruminococcaceae bacterium FB2012]|nr:cell division initiation protein [Ruminococcaceae bacterium FB2012]
MMTASNIKARSFSAVRNGYDPAEVKDFLDEIAQEYEAALKSKEESDEKVKKLNEELAKYREDEEAIKSALVHSQKEASKIISDAKSQARDMIESAKTEEIRLREQSSTECERITKEYHDRCAEMIKQETEKTKQKIDEINKEYRAEKARYDELKREVTLFKAELLPLYQKQLALIMQLPETELEEEDTSAAEEAAAAEAKAAEEAAAQAEAERKAAEEAAEKEHIDKILNTGSFEPVLPKEQDLKFGKNN